MFALLRPWAGLWVDGWRRGVAFAVPLVLALAVLIAPGVARAETLDQSQPSFGSFSSGLGSGFSAAQTFTAGLTGELDRVDVVLAAPTTPGTTSVTVEIRDTSGGAPGSTVLATADASIPSRNFNWTQVNFDAPAPVVSGTQYAIVVYSTAPSFGWAGTTPDVYSGGAPWNGSGGTPPTKWTANSFPADFAFDTYVSLATPSIATSEQPASATVGSSIADQATVSGGNNPTGTVTFNLYDNANGTGTPLFTDTESLVDGVATSAGYTPTATGTDYWVATYNGDTANDSVTSGASSEPVTITVSPAQLAANLVLASAKMGPGGALGAQATAIQKAVTTGRSATACADIATYLGLVRSQTGKKLSAASAAQLTSDADALAVALGCKS